MISQVDQVDIEAIRAGINTDGYAVVHDLIRLTDVDSMRDFWLAEFGGPVSNAPIIWGPYLGEPNGALFDQTETHCLYRAFDYLWNEPYHPLTRQIALELNRCRNRIVGCDERDGEMFEPSRYGIYVTTSYYPCDRGWLHTHRDEMDGRPHWHFVVPLTFRGTDYAAGGLKILDRQENEVDVEDMLKPGSVMFYDGLIPHARLGRSASGARGHRTLG